MASLFKRAALVLCGALVGTTSALRQSREFGPEYIPKNSVRALHRDNNHGFIKFSAVDAGCDAVNLVDQLQVTSYFLGSRLETTQSNWSHNITCGESSEIKFLASTAVPGKEGAYFLLYDDERITAHYADASGIENLGSTNRSFLPLAQGDVTLTALADGTVFLSNPRSVMTLGGTVLSSAPQGGQFWSLASDGDHLFVLGSTSGRSGLFLRRLTYSAENDNATSTQVQLTSSLFNAFPFGGDIQVSSINYFFRTGLHRCGESMVVILTNSDKSSFELHALASDLTFAAQSRTINLADTDALVDFSCSAVTGESQALVNRILLQNGNPTFNYFMYTFTSELTNREDVRELQEGPTTEERIRYVGLVGYDSGAIYVHREKRQDLGLNSEAFGRFFTICPAGTYGPNCEPCLCEQGICDDGEFGTGLCIACNSDRIAGANCELECDCIRDELECSSGLEGNGTCFCDDIYSFGPRCDECIPGYYLNSEEGRCLICQPGFYCVNSTAFPCETNYFEGLTYCMPPTPAPTDFPPLPSFTPTDVPTGGFTEEEDGGLRASHIAAIVVGSVFALLLLLLVIYGLIFYHHYFHGYPYKAI